MLPTEFHVGDVCRFKNLDELQAEFGPELEEISCGWDPKMEFLCGELFTIKEMDRHICYSQEGIEYENRQNYGGHWWISTDMLKPYEPTPDDIDVEIDEQDFKDILFS